MNALRILIADDHAPFRESLLEFLRSQPGVEVVGLACNGMEAVELAEQLHPDLVLMDASMPTLSGFDATEDIKKKLPQTKVIILSSHTGEVYRMAALEHLADGYIEKHLMKTGLVSLLGNVPVRLARVAV